MRRWGILAILGLLLYAALFALAARIRRYQLDNQISLPLIAIAGVMALLGSLIGPWDVVAVDGEGHELILSGGVAVET